MTGKHGWTTVKVLGLLAVGLWVAEYLFLPLGLLGWVLWLAIAADRPYFRDHLVAALLSGVSTVLQLYAVALLLNAAEAPPVDWSAIMPPFLAGYVLGLLAAWLFARHLPAIFEVRWIYPAWVLGAALFGVGGVFLLIALKVWMLWRIASGGTPQEPFVHTAG